MVDDLDLPSFPTLPTADLGISIQANATLGTVLELQAFVVDMTQVGTYPIPVFTSNRATMTVGQFSPPTDDCTNAPIVSEGVYTADNMSATTSAVTGSFRSRGRCRRRCVARHW